jgi:hypothetical protein
MTYIQQICYSVIYYHHFQWYVTFKISLHLVKKLPRIVSFIFLCALYYFLIFIYESSRKDRLRCSCSLASSSPATCIDSISSLSIDCSILCSATSFESLFLFCRFSFSLLIHIFSTNHYQPK